MDDLLSKLKDALLSLTNAWDAECETRDHFINVINLIVKIKVSPAYFDLSRELQMRLSFVADLWGMGNDDITHFDNLMDTVIKEIVAREKRIIGTVKTTGFVVTHLSSNEPDMSVPGEIYNVIHIIPLFGQNGKPAYVTDVIMDHGEHLILVADVVESFIPREVKNG